MQAKKEEEEGNGQGQLEKRVNTVEYWTSAGQGQEQRNNVQIVHHVHPQSHPSPYATSGGVLAGAAAAIANTLQSAKDAISRK
ncbi:uncharacterized protein LOC111017948 [Momordica charantia]|uniref:Uncharacterized protein LOC111017948 n=1 Tax=Momordica charantia TaxID=3673 RepID=A0A6J1D724_MOMCH|nr:uncharacterized protein LOC111017948 [Momordica charantia]